MNKPDYFSLAVDLSRAEGMLTLAQIRAKREREFDDAPRRESEADRELALFDRTEARAFNSGAW